MVDGSTATQSPMSEIDHNHALFLQASDTASAVLVPTLLIGAKNYGLWSRSMRITLLGKGKLGFVNGTCKREA